MAELREITSGLRFPEGPVAMPDGSVIVVEIEAGRVTRVLPGGAKEVVATPGGGPNGAALGPDKKLYVCNNGGFAWVDMPGIGRVPTNTPADYSGGRIERIDLDTGAVEVLYDRCGDIPLKGPNDIVFDKDGGLWFTDPGKRRERDIDRGAVYYARHDGSMIVEVAFPVTHPNGIGISPEGDRLYVSETETGRLWAWEILGPGELKKEAYPSPHGGVLITTLPDFQRFDSLALDAEGNILVATLMSGGITEISPDGKSIRFFDMGDLFTTNICFGGPDLKTAFITLSMSGRLVAVDWERPGLPLEFLNR